MRARHWVLALGSLALGVALCVFLFRWLAAAPADFKILVLGLSPYWCAALVALTAALMAMGAWKWALLARAMHEAPEPAPGFFWRHFLWQNWIGNFVPPSLAIVLGRSWAARKMPGVSLRAGAGNGFYDQAVEFAFLLALLPGSYAALIAWQGWPGFLFYGGMGALFLFALPLAAPRLLPAALRGVWVPVAALSFLRVALTLARLAVGALALGLPIRALAIAAVASPVSILALVPLTPGNLGLAEWGWTGGLALAGTALPIAALYALGVRLLVLVALSLLLGLNESYVFFHRKKAAV